VRRGLLAALPRHLLRERTTLPHALLTFDDGPDPDCTPRVLDLLGAHGIHATFYLIGERAARAPELVRRILDEGHTVGNHTWSHPAPGTLTARQYLEDARRARDVLEQSLGASVINFRPPHGHVTGGILLGLWRSRMQVELWSVDPKDYQATDPRTITSHLDTARPAARDIVLLHDTSAVTVQALRALLPTSAARYRARSAPPPA
jgi:peptidoglycan/xylan/chitin deacetylase (PgdA/CDA1 family)